MRVLLVTSVILTLACQEATVATAAPKIKFHVTPAVSPVPQTGRPNGCWAASAAMVWGWKHNQSIGMDGIAKKAGGNYETLLKTNAVLSEADVQAFATALGLKAEAPRSYTVAGFEGLLRTHGPLWFGTKEKQGLHARVVTGIEGDGTVDGTNVVLIDPATGAAATDTFRQAMEKYEKVATGAIKQGANLTIQIFHP